MTGSGVVRAWAPRLSRAGSEPAVHPAFDPIAPPGKKSRYELEPAALDVHRPISSTPSSNSAFASFDGLPARLTLMPAAPRSALTRLARAPIWRPPASRPLA